MKKLIFLSALFLGNVSVHAQSWQWARQSNDYHETPDYQNSPVIATDIFGNVYAFGTYCAISFGAFTLNGLCGTIPGRVNPESMYLVKYDSLGNLQWLKEIFQGMEGDSANYANALVTDASGNIYVTGSVRDSIFTCGTITIHKNVSETEIGFFLVKIDSNGNEQWVRSAGGKGATDGTSLAVDQANNIYVIGHASDSAVFDSILLQTSPPYSSFIAKYDPAGKIIRAIHLSGQLFLSKIITDKTSNVYISGSMIDTIYLGTRVIGYTNLSGSMSAKFDSSFNLIWLSPNIYIVNTDIAGNIYAMASYDSSLAFDTATHTSAGTPYFVKYNPSGSVIWAKNSNSFLYPYAAIVDTFFNIFMYENSSFGNNSSIVKYDSSCNQIWVKAALYVEHSKYSL